MTRVKWGEQDSSAADRAADNEPNSLSLSPFPLTHQSWSIVSALYRTIYRPWWDDRNNSRWVCVCVCSCKWQNCRHCCSLLSGRLVSIEMRRYCLCWLVLKRNDELSLFFSGLLIAKQTTNLHWFSLCLPTRMTLKGSVLQLSGPKALATFGSMPFFGKLKWLNLLYSTLQHDPFHYFSSFHFLFKFFKHCFFFQFYSIHSRKCSQTPVLL